VAVVELPDLDPLGEEPEPPGKNFDALQQEYPGIVAWISCEGPAIDFPVMQTTDNDYFLANLPNGKKNKLGSIFLDYRNSADFVDRNSLIYGHNMKSGDMFGSLKYYRNQSFYDEHPVMTLYLPEKEYTLKLIAGYVLDSAHETPPLIFQDEDDFNKYIKDIRRRSFFKNDVDVVPEDRLICLCTCTAPSSDVRLIIVGKLAETVNYGAATVETESDAEADVGIGIETGTDTPVEN
jgi:sortase B